MPVLPPLTASPQLHPPRTPPVLVLIMDDDQVLRKLLQAKIACSNITEDLEVIHSLAEDWDGADDRLGMTALEIRLHCESGVKEAVAIHEVLLEMLSNQPTHRWWWTEMELRVEIAVVARAGIISTIDRVIASFGDSHLGVKEMRLRAIRVLAKLEGLRTGLEELKTHVQANDSG